MVLPRFLAELKHRNVYRAAVVYAAVTQNKVRDRAAVANSFRELGPLMYADPIFTAPPNFTRPDTRRPFPATAASCEQ
jgi:hypothetical protein